MSKLARILRIAGWTLAGVAAAEAILLLVAIARFGLHDMDSFRRFVMVTNPMTGIAGGLFGFFFAKELVGRRLR